uniref:Phosphoglucomutase-2 n=1 Tax=Rhabditophanes sp. KR3021 TaxID=114890 RepID=A0AC35TPE8_9BILA
MSLNLDFLDRAVAEKVQFYLDHEKNAEFRSQVVELVQKKDGASLAARSVGKLLFGTAGIRSRMEGGLARLNDLTILQVTTGFAKYIQANLPKEKWSIAIGFDGRYNSKRWSQMVANVFIHHQIKVYIFSAVAPTPVVSYAVIELQTGAGLMMTASHNPKTDNGYKAYWSNGAQIIGPHDDGICALADLYPIPAASYWDYENVQNDPLYNSADVVIDKYFAIESSLIYNKKVNEQCPIKFTYSAFHGIGRDYCIRMFREFGFKAENIVQVKEQCDPNPDFPTIPFPNPEEGARVLKLCIDTADANNSTVILANDPDADRIQLAEKQKDGEWYIFTGNQMGAVITWWMWKNFKQNNPCADFSKVYMLNSAVSSQIVRTIAKKEGFKSDVTLTGFKWMGNEAEKIRNEGNQVILSWEESIGYMPGHTLDKDGVSSAGVFAEIAAFLQVQGKTLKEKLFEIYTEYGFHLVKSTYWVVPNPSVTQTLFGDLRKDSQYPTEIGGVKVRFVRDLTIGYDNEQPFNKPKLPISTSSEMITFTLENDNVITLRASGTEPKIKYYIEMITASEKKESDLVEVEKEFLKLEDAVVQQLLNPTKYGLIAR